MDYGFIHLQHPNFFVQSVDKKKNAFEQNVKDFSYS